MKNFTIKLSALWRVALVVLAIVVAACVGVVGMGSSPASAADDNPLVVRFSSAFKAKPKSVVKRYAVSKIDASVSKHENTYTNTEFEQPQRKVSFLSADSPQPESTASLNYPGRTFETTYCVWGGDSQGGCGHDSGDNTVALARTTNGRFKDIAYSGNWGSYYRDPVAITEDDHDIETLAKCEFDEATGRPVLSGMKPTGILSRTVAGGWQPIDLAGMPNGETKVIPNLNAGEDHVYSGTNSRDWDAIQFKVTLNWGQDETNLRAWSEAKIEWLGYYNGYGSSKYYANWRHYTVRSECGMKLADGRGSETASERSLATGLRSAYGLPSFQDQQLDAAFDSGAIAEQGLEFVPAEDLGSHEVLTSNFGQEVSVASSKPLSDQDKEAAMTALADYSAVAGGPGTHGVLDGVHAGVKWRQFSAADIGEKLPVLQVVLTDGTIIQIRPHLEEQPEATADTDAAATAADADAAATTEPAATATAVAAAVTSQPTQVEDIPSTGVINTAVPATSEESEQ